MSFTQVSAVLISRVAQRNKSDKSLSFILRIYSINQYEMQPHIWQKSKKDRKNYIWHISVNHHLWNKGSRKLSPSKEAACIGNELEVDKKIYFLYKKEFSAPPSITSSARWNRGHVTCSDMYRSTNRKSEDHVFNSSRVIENLKRERENCSLHFKNSGSKEQTQGQVLRRGNSSNPLGRTICRSLWEGKNQAANPSSREERLAKEETETKWDL